MSTLRLWGLAAGLLLLAGLLAGCSLLFPSQVDQTEEFTGAVPSGWVIAAQGEEEPDACVEELNRWEARKEAKEALKEDEEAQALRKTLAALGKRVLPWRAQGCTAEPEDEDENDTEGQGLSALAEEGALELVEIPAGRDAALYLVASEQGEGEGTFWASLKEEVEGGRRLTHLEIGLGGEAGVQGLGAEAGGMSFFLPDGEGTQELAGQVRGWLEGSNSNSDSGTEGAGVRALATTGEFDWTRAEVLILEEGAEGEETEALVVVPPRDTEGQRLWGRKKPRIDVDRALHVKVKVKRAKKAQTKKRSYRVVKREATVPRVTRGRELKRAFRFCPYQYYGRLSSFRRALCQDSWERWYYKQWEKGRVANNALEAYNFAAKAGAYGVVYGRSRTQDPDLLLAGFPQLDKGRVLRLRDLAYEDKVAEILQNLQQLPPELKDRLDKATRIIYSIESPNLAYWVRSLVKALRQGRFDEEYDRLLPKGLDKLQEAALVLLDSQSHQDAKELIRKALPSKEISTPALLEESNGNIIDLRDEVENRLLEAFMAYQLALEAFESIPGVGKVIELFRTLAKAFGAPFTDFNELVYGKDGFMPRFDKALIALSLLSDPEFSTQEVVEFARAILDLVNAYTDPITAVEIPFVGEVKGTEPRNLLAALGRTFELWAFFGWMVEPEDSAELRLRLEQGIGTIYVAARSLRNGWVYSGLQQDTYKNGTWWGAVLFLPAEENPAGRSIVALARGDHCTDCLAKADEIVSWIERAKQIVESGQVKAKGSLGGAVVGDLNVVTFAFTKPGAQGVLEIVSELEDKFGDSAIPIVVSWVDEDGQIWYKCIGSACGSLEDEANRIACNQHGRGAGCGAQEWQGSESESASDGEDPVSVGSPSPPSYCTVASCIVAYGNDPLPARDD